MSQIDELERWKRDIYPKYWVRKSREYGLDHYCKGLLAIIQEMRPKCAFELAIGTGYPFAEKLLACGIDVAGSDISSELVAELKRNFPTIKAYVGGYEDLDKVKNTIQQQFDLVYCFRSTWYFSDISSALDFMLYFTKPGGRVIFDIMNKDSQWNKSMVIKKNRVFILTLIKNATKLMVNLFRPGHYMTDTLFGIREIMYSRYEIEVILKDRGLLYQMHTLEEVVELGGGDARNKSFSSDQKLIFVAYKS